MRILNTLKKNSSYFTVFCLTILYALFLSVNPVGDAYSNAYSSLYAEDMLKPHHLLYCLYGNIILRLFGFLHLEPMIILQLSNAVVAGGCLLVLRRIIKGVNPSERFLSSSILFCGACFGFMRFATDNECYMLPLLFSLLTIYYVQVFLIKNTFPRICKAAICMVLACLFHQLAILVWLCVAGVLLFSCNKKYTFCFLSISLGIPLVYALAAFLTTGNVSVNGTIEFALTDYISGNAQMPQLKQVLLLTFVSLVRTFVQVHGYMFEFINNNLVLSITVFAFVIILAVLAIIAFRKDKHRTLKLFQEKRFVRMLWVLLILTISFAAFSNGNAEFMTMIPFLLVVLHAYYFTSYRAVILFAFALLLWNIWFALYPLGRIEMTPNEKLAEMVLNNKNAVFVLKDKNVVENICLYKYRNIGNVALKHAYKYTKEEYESDKASGKTIITDAIGGKESINRASVTQKVNFAFDEVKNPLVLLKFSSPMCKRMVCKL
ncbi:MAG: hypothetical protein U0L53_03360 [Bacteroidales bacterium]|nr:hypothetical protein [Bacteroidales bacterium]